MCKIVQWRLAAIKVVLLRLDFGNLRDFEMIGPDFGNLRDFEMIGPDFGIPWAHE